MPPVPRRVFLSHTSELARLPADRSFVDAAVTAVIKAGDAPVDMADFGPRAQPPAEVCIGEVTASDVYVGIIGFRYGSPVVDRAHLSYTELEYETAVATGKPLLILTLSDDLAGDPSFFDQRHADRQRAFRARLLASSQVTRVTVTSPGDLLENLLVGLFRLPRRDSAPEPAHVHDFPARSPVFTGRRELLERLHRALRDGPGVQALHGTGGVGKTATAVEYCHRHRDDYDVVWWVPAEEPALVSGRLAELARALGVAGTSETVISAVSRLRTALTQRRRWLLVFDNAEDPAALAPYLAPGPGHTLITSRNPAWEEVATTTPVEVMDGIESVALLRKRLPDLPESEADRIADALDHLPLALSQAAAYLADTGMVVADYLGLLSHRTSDVLAEGKPVNYPVSFVSGLRIACEGLAADRPPALDLLTLAAFMAPEPIPLTLFARHTSILPDRLADAAADPLAFAGLVRVLRRRSLARIGAGSLQVHRLVQKILREESGGVRKTAVALLAAELRTARRDPDTGRWNDLLPHVLAVTDPAADPQGAPLPMDTEHLVYAAVHHLRTQGKASAARPLLERVLRSREIRYGPSHAVVGNVLIHLGWALRDLGDPAGAYAVYDRARHIRQAQYGSDHPQVATALTNCGLSLRDLGRPGAARPLHERALSIRERTYGPDHRHVATVLTYLGQALTDLGEPAQARPLHERALAIRVSTYGPDHRHVATVLTNLGQTLAALGDLESAREVLERALRIREQAYGPDHPRVGATAEVLGLVMRDLGAVSAARTLLQRSHRLVALAYGQAHPTTRRIAAETATLP